MRDRNFARIPAATSAEVYQYFRLSREAAALRRDDQTPGQFLDLLTARRLFNADLRGPKPTYNLGAQHTFSSRDAPDPCR